MITLLCLFSIVSFLLLAVFLTLCVFVGGGVPCVYMCVFLVDWVGLCFGFVC